MHCNIVLSHPASLKLVNGKIHRGDLSAAESKPTRPEVTTGSCRTHTRFHFSLNEL